MNSFVKFVLTALLITAVVAGAAVFKILDFARSPLATGEKIEVVFEIKPGEAYRQVVHKLEAQHLIASAWQLQIYGRLTGAGGKVRVGEYALSPTLSPKEILQILESGRSIEHSLTVPEGANRFEIADLLEQSGICNCKRDEFLKLTSDPQLIHELLDRRALSLEGYLFPDTYRLTKYSTVRALVKQMVQHFMESYDRLKETPGWSKGSLTDSELVTLASIIEKETGAPEERPVISSVFHNRLRIRMPLQTDPTIIYGMWDATGTWTHNIRRVDLQTPGKWNSYLNQGLPPGPISNPGFEALQAAGAPAQTEYLYFVSQNNGTHVFSKTYAQHQQAVTKYQLDQAARAGKSWRDLKKRETVPTDVVAAPDLPAAKPKTVKKK